MTEQQAKDHQGYQLGWEDSGKPALEHSDGGGLNISIAHNSDFYICTVGDACQGCDLEAIRGRDLETWHGLLGASFADVFTSLTATDTVDLAGTRVWAAKEAVLKAQGTPCLDMSELERNGDAVLLEGRTESERLLVLTYPVALSEGPSQMLAVIVESDETAQKPQPETQFEKKTGAIVSRPTPTLATGIEKLPKELRYLYPDDKLNPFEVDVDFGPMGQPVYVWRFPLTFRDAADVGGGVYFARYLGWMGQIRELSVGGILPELRDLYTSGKWGTVTNSWETFQLDDAEQEDIVEGRLYCTRVYGRHNAAFDLVCEWTATNRRKEERPLALTLMTASWVEVVGHGEVALAPMPEFFQKYMNLMVTPLGPPNTQGLVSPESRSPIASLWGETLAEHPRGAAGWPVVHSATYQTTIDHGNVVGNIYYANYPSWAGQARDVFLHKLAPQLYHPGDYQGEFLCRRMKIGHLREAMPFDRVAVDLSIRSVYRHGVSFAFTFYREDVDGTRTKLAAGEQDVVFARRNGSRLDPVPLPPAVEAALCGATSQP